MQLEHNNVIEKKFAQYDKFICLPITINKKPVVSWKNLTETPKHAFKDEHNIALITGEINGVIVIDIDIPKINKDELNGMTMMNDLLKKFNGSKNLNIPTCQTQSGGLHLYFKYDPDIKTTTGVNGYSIDIRNDGALVVVPPSIGIRGPYMWKDNLSLHDTELINIPRWFKNWLLMSTTKTTKTDLQKKVNKSVKVSKCNGRLKQNKPIEPIKSIKHNNQIKQNRSKLNKNDKPNRPYNPIKMTRSDNFGISISNYSYLFGDSDDKVQQHNEKSEFSEFDVDENENSLEDKLKNNKTNVNHIAQKDDGYIYIYDEDEIIDLLSKLPKKYIFEYQYWLKITSCLKSENLFDIWDEWSKKCEEKYDAEKNKQQWDDLNPKLNINYLGILTRYHKLDVKPYIIKCTKKIKFLTAEPDMQIDTHYLEKKDIVIENINNINNIDKKLVIVKSSCGTGKTSAAAKYIKQLCKETNNPFLSITVRVSLGYQHLADLSKNKFKTEIYKTIPKKRWNDQKNLIIQADSLHKLKVKKWRDSVIYLDEVASLLSYILSSSTLEGKRVRIFNKLYELLKTASKIIVTDADINDMVLSYFNNIGIKYNLVENIYKRPTKRPAYEYNNKEILIRKLEQQLSKGEQLFVCFDCKREMDIIVERLKRFCEKHELYEQLNKFLVYSSTEGDENDFMIVNDKWKVRHIFYSPKITIGLNFDIKTPRDIYLIALGNSINSFGFMQQISRCRNVRSLHYYVANRYQPLKYKSVDDVKKHYKKLLQNYDDFDENKIDIDIDIDNYINNVNGINYINIDDLNYNRTDQQKLDEIIETGNAQKNLRLDTWTLHDTVFNEIFFINEYYDNILRSAPREQFRWMLEDKEYYIIKNTDELDVDEIEEANRSNKIAKENVNVKNEQTYRRALYDNPEGLTTGEKKIRQDSQRRAIYLKINFDKKIQKKKWEKYLIDDKEFNRHMAYRLLIGSENKLDDKIAAQMKKDYKISICKSMITKVKLIKQIENILEIKTLDIDTQRDMDRFDEPIEIDDELIDSVKKVFRINKPNEKINSDYGHLYYQLIHLYKQVLGDQICDYNIVTIRNVRHKKYIINEDVLNVHKTLNAQVLHENGTLKKILKI